MRRLILDAKDAGLTDQTNETTTHGSVGEERQVAILFVDIRSSTSFAESVPPFDVIHVLRRFYHHMERAVMDNGGYVACYTGDGLMALFGVERSESAPLQAVLAGLDMVRSVKEDVKRLFQCPFRIGVGVRFGDAVVGTVGGGLHERVTAIGDAVNIAHRVERANKRAGTEFLVSEGVLRAVQGQVRVGKAISVKLRGKTGKHALHEIVGIRMPRRRRGASSQNVIKRARGEAAPKT
jgi:adenylate cyclase